MIRLTVAAVVLVAAAALLVVALAWRDVAVAATPYFTVAFAVLVAIDLAYRCVRSPS